MHSPRLPYLTSRLQGFGTTIFSEMTRLATEHSAVNLGQGFPDFDGPEFVKRAAIDAIESGHNQYCRSFGIPTLNAAIAAHQERFWGLRYHPETEITVYAGATEAIFATLQALCDVGDEVVLFEPYYDSYMASVAAAGAVARPVKLVSPDFAYDPAELERAITPRTRLLLLNSPHNPSGKVFGRDELEHIAQLCTERDLIAVTDEVYEHLVFEGEHIPLASLPGMRERTVQISSLGKSFSLTGWKIGHTCASPPLTRALRTAHQFITFCNGSPLQVAAAVAYAAPDSYFDELSRDYRIRRDRLCAGLADIGFEVLPPAGTYFVQTDIRPLGYDDDVAFCRMLPEQVGVAAIPTSAFYANKQHGKHLVRWAFCKTLPIIDAALERLQKLRP
ncbi:aminotransferase class I/II-fold pyridoxal phosphate-dependent enzyme [Haliangium ochraceum]|uniref:Aminotransferase class I and II n=1 Tax=Haliangium ochraceum (strain DSM 14365 / JCM 11303 / SMP-2) TaxID=502025 RepID=D0LKK7_HALO1|nr:aminotransferase class I/II-fold pyridoxal phosphate-dependent enzyme [Haliangium ochraceum]ACY15055.1 aminotransferase class I and II [Haliangium ochraceum DSM 14365]